MDTNSSRSPLAAATPELGAPDTPASTPDGARVAARPRRKKLSPAESRIERLRIARVTAPLLRDLQPSAASVSVQITFADDARLACAAQSFAIYPPARAYFVYACAFGDCDGTHDLGAEVLGVLKAGASQISGSRCCEGQKAGSAGDGPRCGLKLTYAVSVLYEAPQPQTTRLPVAGS